MKYEFVKLSPTQNMTIIVKSPVPRARQAQVAGALMSYDSVYGEQAGFMEPATLPGAAARLQMMGGEFCGNASMCAAVLAARDAGIAQGEQRLMPMEISGAEGVVGVRVKAMDGFYECAVDMPLPATFADWNGLHIVRLPGIIHAVMPTNSPEAETAKAPELLKKLAADMNADAAGMILYSRAEGRIVPLVYVRGADSMVWERGCGSGSAAVGALEAYLTGTDSELALSQPGGVINVRAKWNGREITGINIAGQVRIVAEGTAYI